ncbi:hypothetical protein SISSUDRAFT_1046797 [Sistotremastrum suecicum HHB10207 ss-3]|uniref:Uncharacterized protein n=1 Tax=Sistotremastrum suecicum HHB10207 ss-3 TaxID=1314776 RepID=A0A166DKF5_9AGAM|nr:hypothetical protein SISSUDRAFT_1046797 [Sistotremastrum suecicum HHB10207 ss-3]
MSLYRNSVAGKIRTAIFVFPTLWLAFGGVARHEKRYGWMNNMELGREETFSGLRRMWNQFPRNIWQLRDQNHQDSNLLEGSERERSCPRSTSAPATPDRIRHEHGSVCKHRNSCSNKQF